MCGHRAEAMAAAAANSAPSSDLADSGEPSPSGTPNPDRDTTFSYEQEHRLRSVRPPPPSVGLTRAGN
jgi:hypothetical protein